MTDEYNDDLLPSKTQEKLLAIGVQELGEKLLDLKPDERERLPLTQELIDALSEATRIKSLEARRRHAQFIGKLMRRAEHAEIEQALHELKNPARRQRLQDWIEQIEPEQDRHARQQLMHTLLEWYPHTDRQHLRNLLRNLWQKRVEGEPTPAQLQAYRQERRKLSHYLNELEQAAPLLPEG